jgi:hypothetical protein
MNSENNTKISPLKEFLVAGYENITHLIVGNLEWLLVNSIVIALQLLYIYFTLPWYLWVIITFFGITCITYPATFALTRYVADLAEYKVPSFLIFFKYYLKFWKRSIKCGRVVVLCILVILANIHFYFSLGAKSRVFAYKFIFYLIVGAWLWVLVIIAAGHIHLFPMLVLMEDFSLLEVLRRSMLLTLAFPVRSFWTFFLAIFLSLVWVFTGVGALFFVASAPVLLIVVFFRLRFSA